MERKIYSETDRQIEWLSTDRDKETKEEEYKLGEIKITTTRAIIVRWDNDETVTHPLSWATWLC